MNEIEFPYLDRKISSDSLEYAKENIWYHLLHILSLKQI